MSSCFSADPFFLGRAQAGRGACPRLGVAQQVQEPHLLGEGQLPGSLGWDLCVWLRLLNASGYLAFLPVPHWRKPGAVYRNAALQPGMGGVSPPCARKLREHLHSENSWLAEEDKFTGVEQASFTVFYFGSLGNFSFHSVVLCPINKGIAYSRSALLSSSSLHLESLRQKMGSQRSVSTLWQHQ